MVYFAYFNFFEYMYCISVLTAVGLEIILNRSSQKKKNEEEKETEKSRHFSRVGLVKHMLQKPEPRLQVNFDMFLDEQ